MTWRQFRLWTQYYANEPFGEERADYRIGTLASLYVNAHLPKGSAASKPSDFMPYLRTQEPELTDEEKYRRSLESWETFLGGKIAQAEAESLKREQ